MDWPAVLPDWSEPELDGAWANAIMEAVKISANADTTSLFIKKISLCPRGAELDGGIVQHSRPAAAVVLPRLLCSLPRKAKPPNHDWPGAREA